jgi:hypothetical protein
MPVVLACLYMPVSALSMSLSMLSSGEPFLCSRRTCSARKLQVTGATPWTAICVCNPSSL